MEFDEFIRTKFNYTHKGRVYNFGRDFCGFDKLMCPKEFREGQLFFRLYHNDEIRNDETQAKFIYPTMEVLGQDYHIGHLMQGRFLNFSTCNINQNHLRWGAQIKNIPSFFGWSTGTETFFLQTDRPSVQGLQPSSSVRRFANGLSCWLLQWILASSSSTEEASNPFGESSGCLLSILGGIKVLFGITAALHGKTV